MLARWRTDGRSTTGPDALSLRALARMAHAFDELSDSEAAGAMYPASAFVEFVRAEVDGAGSKFEPGHRPRRKNHETPVQLRPAAGE